MQTKHTRTARRFATAVVLAAGIAGAQTDTRDEPLPPDAARALTPRPQPSIQIIRGRGLPAGTVLEGELDNTVATGSVRSGDIFTVTIRSPIVDDHGRNALPTGTRLVGRVIEAVQATEPNEPSTLRLTIDGLGVRGEVLPIETTITHLEPTITTAQGDNLQRARIVAGSHVSVALTDFVPFAQIEGVPRGAIGGGPVIR